MTFWQSLEFSYGLAGRYIDAASVVWALMAFLISFLVFGVFWGMLWNRSWGLFNHLPSAALNLLFALAVAATVIGWRGAHRSMALMDSERATIGHEIAGSGTLNRAVLKDTWDKLYPLGGQHDLAAPQDGGNELRLNSQSDARALAEAAAGAIKQPLVHSDPFRLGAPVHVRDPQLVAQDVLSAVQQPNYPVIVAPDNPWTRAAVVDQVNTAFESAGQSLRKPMSDLKTALAVLIFVLAGLQLVLTPVSAINDIKASPKI
jgi:hypothetical protein